MTRRRERIVNECSYNAQTMIAIVLLSFLTVLLYVKLLEHVIQMALSFSLLVVGAHITIVVGCIDS